MFPMIFKEFKFHIPVQRLIYSKNAPEKSTKLQKWNWRYISS